LVQSEIHTFNYIEIAWEENDIARLELNISFSKVKSQLLSDMDAKISHSYTVGVTTKLQKKLSLWY